MTIWHRLKQHLHIALMTLHLLKPKVQDGEDRADVDRAIDALEQANEIVRRLSDSDGTEEGPVSERAPRDNWGQMFRNAVASGKAVSCFFVLVSLIVVRVTEGVPQWFALVVGLVALAALYPKSPVVAAVVQRIPGLPTKGQGT